jgi:hypothetical protein
LLENEGMVDAVGLAAAGANFDIMGEAGLEEVMVSILARECKRICLVQIFTFMAACKALAISLSCSSLGLLPRISGSQNWPTAPFMWPILPWGRAGALTHWEGSRPTPQTM